MTIADIEENDVMQNGKEKFADADAKKSAETDAADAKDIESGEEKVDEVKLLPHDKSNVDKEDNDESKVDEMKFPDYDRMNFNWRKNKQVSRNDKRWMTLWVILTP